MRKECAIFRQPNSLYWRLLLPLGGALLLAMLAAWAIALKLLTTVIDQQLDAKLGNATRTLAENVFPFSPELIDRLDRLIESRIALLDDNGRIGLSTGSDVVNDVLQDNFEQYAISMASDPVFLTFDADGMTWRAVVQALPPGRDDRYRFVLATASLEDTNAAAREAAILLGAAMLVATLILALLASYFVRSITRPVADLAAMANSISEGRRDIAASVDERNEIGVLANALNDMATRLESYERDLSESSRLSGLGDLAARMAHEIRNPLTAIKLQLDMLEERVVDDDLKRIQSVLDEIRRLELIVSSALSVGGAHAVDPQPTDAGAMLLDITDLMQPTLAHRQIQLTTNIEALPPMALDAHRMKQVLLNLINNAADELDRGGTIHLAATIETDGSANITIEDSGPGMSDTGTASKKPLGLGLGLKISREIVERHNSEFIIGKSDRLGGAKFTIRLPASIMSVPTN